MERTSRIYVAGHRGLVGSAVVDALRRHGYANILCRSRQELDLRDTSAVRAFFTQEHPEFVVLAAARAGGIKESMTYPAEFLVENLQIQNNVLWEAHRAGVRKLLFLGSSCIYPRECVQPMREEHLLGGPLEPTNEGYALAKIAGMKLCEYISAQYGKRFISCIPCNIYGEGDYFDADRGHVIASLILRMHRAREAGLDHVDVWGTGDARREFLYSDDLAEACVFLLESYEGKEFLNVGSGEDLSIRELAGLIREVVGFDGELVFDASKPDGMPRKLLDVGRLHALGWRHRVSLAEGIGRAYRSFLRRHAGG
jgi:GDP-L-fucose synthase